jgi:hypothetical protein
MARWSPTPLPSPPERKAIEARTSVEGLDSDQTVDAFTRHRQTVRKATAIKKAVAMAAEQFFSGGKILAPHVAMLKLDQAGTEAVEIERSDYFSIKPLTIDLEQIEILEAVLDDERIEPQRWHVDTLQPILRNSTLPRHNRWIRRCDCQSILYFLTRQHLLTGDAIQS